MQNGAIEPPSIAELRETILASLRDIAAMPGWDCEK